MKRVIKLIFLLWSVVFTACGGSGLPPFDDSDGASGPPSAASSPTMYLKLIDSTKYEYMQYQVLPTFDFTKICEVSKTAVTNEDLSCVFDVNEMDLYFWGGTLEFVVPPEICHYVQFSHYWHYNYEVGFGPSAITMELFVDDAGNPTAAPECTVDGVGPTANCPATSEVTLNTTDREVSCIYDQSGSGGPNCCFGNYSFTIIENNTVSGGATSTTSNNSWGGNYSQCLSGPAITDSSWPKTSTGFPMSRLWYTWEEGLSDQIKLTAPLTSHAASNNHEIANWHAFVEGVDISHRHNGPTTTRTSDFPIMLDPIEDRSGTALTASQGAYRMRCLDENDEVIHQIRLYIREYNTRAAFYSFLASPVNGTQNADVVGAEGGACSGIAGTCNDQTDLDDYVPPGNITPPYNCCFPQIGP